MFREKSSLGFELKRLVHAPRRPLDGNDDRVVDHRIDGGGGDNCGVEIVTELFKIVKSPTPAIIFKHINRYRMKHAPDHPDGTFALKAD